MREAQILPSNPYYVGVHDGIASPCTVRPMLHTFWTLGLAVSGAIIGYPLSRLASRRSAEQPVAVELDAERCLLTSVGADPYDWIRVAELHSDEFAHPSHQQAWARISEVLTDLPRPTEALTGKKADAYIESVRSTGVVTLEMRDSIRTIVDQCLDQTLDQEKARSRNNDELVDAGRAVLAAAEDRTRFNGASPIVDVRIARGGDTNSNPLSPTESPLVRVVVEPSLRRNLIISALGAMMFAGTVPAAVAANTSTAGALLSILALSILAASSLLWAVVDWDTMYLDTKIFWPSAAAAWVVAIVAAVVDGDLHRVLAGVVIAVAGALLFEGANLGFRLLRGMDGMGGGDTMILLATAGVPAAVTGSWQLGYYCMIGSLLLGIVGWIVLRIAGRITREHPFAFGPYLALGWVLCCVVWGVM